MPLAKSIHSNWFRFNKYLYRYWRLYVLGILLELFAIPLSLLNPYLAKILIDKAYPNQDLKLFIILAVVGGGIFIFNGLISSLTAYLSERVKSAVNFDITKGLFRHLQSLSVSFFKEKSTGELLFRINSDVWSVSNFVCDITPKIVVSLPRLLFILVIIFYLHWRLALLALLLAPLSLVQPYILSKWLKEITQRLIDKSQGMFKELQELFSHIPLVKALGREDYQINRFEKELSQRMSFDAQNIRLQNIGDFLSSLLNKIIAGIIALYAGYQVIKGRMTLGSLTAIMIYLNQFVWLIKSLGEFYETIAVSSVSCQRLCEVLDITPEIKEKNNALDYPVKQGRIEFQGVCFGYKKDIPILENINFLIKPCSKTAIIGKSGCGKTTLISLILRLYDIEEGAILIDGLNIKEMKLKSLKEPIGIALQEPFLWNDTFAHNILYGKDAAGEREVIEAAKLALAHDFIMSFPKQYDSVIGEMACNISEGQKQRIAIARALIKKPKILILDEAMSSLDSETEDKIIDNIRSGFKDSTVIIVSHRLSSVKKMDLVYFLKSSSSIKIGTHEELMDTSPEYKDLFASQIEQRQEVVK